MAKTEQDQPTVGENQLARLVEQYQNEGFAVLGKWSGTIIEMNSKGPFVNLRKINESDSLDNEEYLCTLKPEVLALSSDPQGGVNKIFYLIAYQDPYDYSNGPQLEMAFWQPPHLTPEDWHKADLEAERLLSE